jgi:hypothetical protein
MVISESQSLISQENFGKNDKIFQGFFHAQIFNKPGDNEQ